MIKPDLPELNKDAEKENNCVDEKSPEKDKIDNQKKLVISNEFIFFILVFNLLLFYILTTSFSERRRISY